MEKSQFFHHVVTVGSMHNEHQARGSHLDHFANIVFGVHDFDKFTKTFSEELFPWSSGPVSVSAINTSFVAGHAGSTRSHHCGGPVGSHALTRKFRAADEFLDPFLQTRIGLNAANRGISGLKTGRVTHVSSKSQ